MYIVRKKNIVLSYEDICTHTNTQLKYNGGLVKISMAYMVIWFPHCIWSDKILILIDCLLSRATSIKVTKIYSKYHRG